MKFSSSVVRYPKRKTRKNVQTTESKNRKITLTIVKRTSRIVIFLSCFDTGTTDWEDAGEPVLLLQEVPENEPVLSLKL